MQCTPLIFSSYYYFSSYHSLGEFSSLGSWCIHSSYVHSFNGWFRYLIRLLVSFLRPYCTYDTVQRKPLKTILRCREQAGRNNAKIRHYDPLFCSDWHTPPPAAIPWNCSNWFGGQTWRVRTFVSSSVPLFCDACHLDAPVNLCLFKMTDSTKGWFYAYQI